MCFNHSACLKKDNVIDCTDHECCVRTWIPSAVAVGLVLINRQTF